MCVCVWAIFNKSLQSLGSLDLFTVYFLSISLSRYMHYEMRPYVVNLAAGEGDRGASYSPRSATSSSRPVNDMRCMPVYEELDAAADTLPRPLVGL